MTTRPDRLNVLLHSGTFAVVAIILWIFLAGMLTQLDPVTRSVTTSLVAGLAANVVVTRKLPDSIETRMRELFERVDTAASSGSPIREVIIATNPSPEGDVTLLYLQERLGPKVPKITSMARGLPFGADLQYADAVTISRSLEERRGVE